MTCWILAGLGGTKAGESVSVVSSESERNCTGDATSLVLADNFWEYSVGSGTVSESLNLAYLLSIVGWIDFQTSWISTEPQILRASCCLYHCHVPTIPGNLNFGVNFFLALWIIVCLSSMFVRYQPLQVLKTSLWIGMTMLSSYWTKLRQTSLRTMNRTCLPRNMWTCVLHVWKQSITWIPCPQMNDG